MAAYRDKEDLISIGAYQRGTDPLADVGIALRPQINGFLRQRVDDQSTTEDADAQLLAIGAEIRGHGPAGVDAQVAGTAADQTA
jgi:flagellum-specific ATP synthase